MVDQPATDIACHALPLRDEDGGPVVAYRVELVNIAVRPAEPIASLTADEAILVSMRLREAAHQIRVWEYEARQAAARQGT